MQGHFLVSIARVDLLEKARHGGMSLRWNVQSLFGKLEVVAYDLLLLQHAQVSTLCVLSCKLSRTRWLAASKI